MNVMLVPVNVMSPVPDVLVVPVSRFRLCPTDKVAVLLMSARAATGNREATAMMALNAAIFLVSFKRQGTHFIRSPPQEL
jgi:hypothetical protein